MLLAAVRNGTESFKGGVVLKLANTGALVTRLRTVFPDREFIMRSQGQVRFVRISSRKQMVAVGAAVGLAGLWAFSLGSIAVSHFSADTRNAALVHREAQVEHAAEQVDAYRAGLDKETADLQRRQKFIEEMVDAHLGGDFPKQDQAADAGTDGEAPDAAKPAKVSMALPEARTLDAIKARQLAMVDRLTRYADTRSDNAIAAIRKLGLNPTVMMTTARGAQGGPLLKLTTSSNGTVDPRFRKLGSSLSRMDALENGLASIPQVSPAHVAYVSSSYGFRSDPFTGAAAFHAGLDFPGPLGSPIYAAAKGVVSFVGRRSGYGNCIEISHGNGLMTRYGHLSKFDAHVGEHVDAGTVIAAMGSTGRSTGSHLHFEVRVNGKPVNPRPFLEAAQNVQQQEAP